METKETSSFTCRRCGKAVEDEFDTTPEDGLCFECQFWAMQKGEPVGLVIEGKHYRVGLGWGPFRGFGGRRFVIETFDGRRVETDDLWVQGDIPEHFRAEMPDNARFVREGDVDPPGGERPPAPTKLKRLMDAKNETTKPDRVDLTVIG